MQVKKKWWWILIPVLLLIVTACVLFRDTIVMYIAPKTVLTAALTDTVSKLDQRSQGSPLRIFLKGYDENGQNTASMELLTSNDLLGEIAYDMTVQADWSVHKLTADGTVTTGSTKLGLSAYLDKDFAAVTSTDLLQGGFYGITYNTFGSDIRRFRLLSLLTPDATLREWENSVFKIQAFMSKDRTLPQLPELTRRDVTGILIGVLALKSHVAIADVQVNGETLRCYQVTYAAEGEQVGEVLGYLLDAGNLSEGKVTASFYLYDKTLVKAELTGTAGEDSVQYILTLGKDAALENLTLVTAKQERGESSRHAYTVQTVREGERYAETIVIDGLTIRYNWNPSSGDMLLTLPEKEAISLTLTETENGFQIKTRDFAELVGLEGKNPYDCTMTVTKGAAITTPTYKNLDQWSWEDLLVLLKGVGSLFGINIQR